MHLQHNSVVTSILLNIFVSNISVITIITNQVKPNSLFMLFQLIECHI